MIAGVQIAPQKTELMKAAQDAGVEMQVIVLDITNEADRQAAFNHEVDVLMNNAGTMETDPVAEMPWSLLSQRWSKCLALWSSKWV